MTGALALLFGALLVAVHGQRLLLRLTRSVLIDPQVVIVAWLTTLLSVVCTAVAGVVFLGLPGHGGLGELLGRLTSCWTALSHGALPSWEQGSAVIGAAAVVVIAVRLFIVAQRQTVIRRGRREQYRFLLALVGTSDAQGATPQMVWLDHQQPIAFSVAGRPGLIVLSRGLRDQLPPLALAATVAHEQAHLRGHHRFMLDVVDAIACALPPVPLFRTAPAALRELVEAGADCAAMRRYGWNAVSDALRTLTFGGEPEGGLAMASTATARRLARLEAGRGVWSGPARAGWGAVIGMLAAVLPAAAGLSVLVSVACSVGGR